MCNPFHNLIHDSQPLQMMNRVISVLPYKVHGKVAPVLNAFKAYGGEDV
jgi:hypothetical protein